MSETHYQLLGIHEKASFDEIKAAYRVRAKALHPDTNKAPDAEEKFKQIALAYEILSNRKTRREYDYELKLDDKTKKKIQEYQDNFGISVYEPKKKKKEKQPRQQQHSRASADFEDIPPGYIDTMNNPNHIGGIL